MARRVVTSRGRGAKPRSLDYFAFQLNPLSREIGSALLKRAGGLVLSAVAGLGLAFVPSQARADTFQVTSTSDPGVGGCTVSECTLREAVDAANSLSGPDTVIFDSTVTGTITLSGTDIEITDDLTITGPGAEVLTVDANYDTSDAQGESRIFDSFADLTTISELTLTNGYAHKGGAIFASGDLALDGVTVRDSNAVSGGGFFVEEGSVTLTSSTVSGNTARGDGGGFRVYYGSVILKNSIVSGNTASGDGGGFRVVYGSVTLTNSTVSGNTASNNGGGFRVVLGPATLTNSTVSGNTAGNLGGGFYVGYEATLHKSTVIGNSAGDDGGGFWGGFDLTLTHSTVSGNTATNFGGGFYVTGTADIDYSTVSDNQAGFGGGFLVRSGDLVLENSTVSGNMADMDGGGFNFSYGAAAKIYHSTISGNTADRDGGGFFMFEGDADIYSSTIARNFTTGGGDGGGLNARIGDVTLHNSILADNFDSYSPFYDAAVVGGVLTGYFTLVENTDNITLNGSNNTMGSDPDLDPLGDNGGPTLTHAIGRESPAYNVGDPSFTSPPDFDQRGPGFPRVQLTVLDMGAYEFQGADPSCGFAQDFVDVSGEIFGDSDFDACVRVIFGGPTILFQPATVEVRAGEEVKIKGISVKLGSTLSIQTGPGVFP